MNSGAYLKGHLDVLRSPLEILRRFMCSNFYSQTYQSVTFDFVKSSCDSVVVHRQSVLSLFVRLFIANGLAVKKSILENP